MNIGKNIFIGTGTFILKGTTIGDNAVVDTRSVVKGATEGDTIAARAPARPIRSIREEIGQAG